MSTEDLAVDGANPAAPVETQQEELSAAPAEAEGQEESKEQERARDEKGRFQSRVNELTRNWRQAERERDALYAQLQQHQTQQPKQAQGETPPSIEDFQNINEWAQAVAKHAQAEAVKVAQREFAERQYQSQQEQVFQSYAVREREYAAQHPEYVDAYSALQSSVQFRPEALEVIAASDVGPAVVQFLGQHLDVADRIARLPLHMQAAEIARVEAQVKASPKPKPVTKAPSPAPTLGGSSVVSKDPERMSTDEWLAWRNSQLQQRHGGR